MNAAIVTNILFANGPTARERRLSVLFLLLLIFSLPVQSKSDLGIGIKVFEKMQEAQTMMDQEKFDEALRILDDILAQKRLNNYEIAQTHSIKGSIYFQQENIKRALEMFEQVLSYENIPAGFREITLKTLSQLTFMEEDYQKALKYSQLLLEMAEIPDPNNYMLVAQIYFKMENYPSALENARKAVSMERELGNQIKENWYLVLNAIYYSMNDYKNMLEVLKELVALYPRERYIMNLASVHGQMEENKQQMLLMEPLYDAGYLAREAELMNLANLMMLYKVPYKAARVLEKGFKDGAIKRTKRNLEMLAQSWQLAAEDEKSVEYFAEAAKLADDGNTYVSLGQTYMNLYRWKEAEQAFENAIKKGGLQKEGDTHLLMGMTRFYQKQYLSARKAFLDAKKFDGTEKLADQWITYMEQEQEKEEAVKQL